ncbi:TetR/AcrR family transcriptional regulator [Nocardioides okcheonensis]|uniref:TetR/AcrR family transcriptional regulator n=1 Tax=Nocardioides okcheonensis TaxID=2894081 RepID=UPI001E338DE3|nr:TetR/AcrR family transcriptional regulator [Nocardioides okcheonensis]UFN46530.1 TetR/AcrR family transcriptional regulator [Nocardioides okcheonensis]
MTPRARPMAPEDRRQALVDATLPLLLAHGRAVTTKQIADAAGVAEGTIFRVFDSKDDLVTAAVEDALDLVPFIAQLGAVDRDQPLAAMLLEVVELFQQRFERVFALMTRMGMVGPPRARRHMEEERAKVALILETMAEPHRAALRVAPAELMHMVRLLTFSGTHPHISDGHPLTAEQIVDTLLHGVLRTEDS